MQEQISYQSTIRACYIGNFVQAVVINLTPILFIPLREQFGLSYSQFGALVLVNFITQVLTDVLFSKAVDRYGFRKFAVIGHFLCCIGFVLFAAAPFLAGSNVFIGFLLATVVFSGAGGLLELLLSPIVDAIPTDEKAKAMVLLHSSYAWGQVAVVAITTLIIFIFGGKSWPVIVLLWAIIPLVNAFLFMKVPLARKVSEESIMKVREMLVKPIFILAFLAIAFGGATEVTMSQWASSFMEKGLDLPKIIGDMFGMCGFALFLGIGRLLHGMYGSRLNLNMIMIAGSGAAALCYLTVALSPVKAISLAACCICGICVSLLWPGTLVIASERLPLAGASMFAFLAAGGDVGASIGPWLTGVVADFINTSVPKELMHSTGLSAEQLALRIGILIAVIFPLGAMVLHIRLRKKGVPKKVI